MCSGHWERPRSSQGDVDRASVIGHQLKTLIFMVVLMKELSDAN